jgi:hypothetical protein
MTIRKRLSSFSLTTTNMSVIFMLLGWLDGNVDVAQLRLFQKMELHPHIFHRVMSMLPVGKLSHKK